jgi:hypothetical protein
MSGTAVVALDDGASKDELVDDVAEPVGVTW